MQLSIMIMILDCGKKLFHVFEKLEILQLPDVGAQPPPDHPPAILTYFVPPQIFGVGNAPASMARETLSRRDPSLALQQVLVTTHGSV